MKKRFAVFPALLVGMTAVAYAQATPTKVAIIAVQTAILGTKDGQKATADLQNRFSPKKAELDKKQADLASLQDQLKKGSATMSDAAKEKITRDIDTLNKSITRDGEDFEAEVQQEEQKIMNDLGQKMMDVIIKYATQNGFALVVDVSNPQTPVLWADQSINITEPIVKLYDQAHPGAAPAAPPAPAAAKPPAPTPKQTPPSTPATKKQ
ncbi:MAG TPA: OmpH family outer membrane protein [Bryobacteraceae bacterium]|nr:OmpH family outer membrane protein [Bryobacteraceae bacterium]